VPKKPRKETPAGRISRLLRSAFSEAAVGNEGEARGFWKSAVKAGYAPDPHTERGLEIAILKGLRETRRDHPA
jgi:hypothetical protein